MRIGIVGCGNVSSDYFESCATYPQLEVAACADANLVAAEEQAARYGIPRVQSTNELLTDPSIELVVNLTPPAMHADITLAAISGGKHVFSEKPLATSLQIADTIIAAARHANVSVGCAPATFLGGGLQTSRKLIDDGWIGEPVAAAAFVTSRGYEHWHPYPDSFYGPGGGPVLDQGPYYITALVQLLGPAVRVAASTRRFSPTRPRPVGTAGSAGSAGSPEIPVLVATHAAGTIDFASGPVATLIASWEIWSTHLPYLEIYGTEGTLSVPNPDEFSGTPAVRRGEPDDLVQVPTGPAGGNWYQVPMTHSGDVGRGIAIADMVDAIRAGRSFRASSDFAYHTLEVMLAFAKSSETHSHVAIRSSCMRPAALPPGVAGHQLRLT
jgi:predicted dehydrogenase